MPAPALTIEGYLDELSIHRVGNPMNNGSLLLSDKPLTLSEKADALLHKYFFHSFTVPEFYAFESDLNPVLSLVNLFWNQKTSWHPFTVELARQLSAATKSPLIKEGDLLIARFDSLTINGIDQEAIGIFKAETKDDFLSILFENPGFAIETFSGILTSKLDKGCLILRHPSGNHQLLIVDSTNRTDTKYWTTDFLGVKPVADHFYHTRHFLDLTHDFVSDKITNEFAVSKADQADLMNRSMAFFKDREKFDQQEYESTVLADANVIESFRQHGKRYQQELNEPLPDQFTISAPAVKQSARLFKSIIKLDKNFHIYIHGERKLIEKGFDESTGKHFYKIYFDQET